MSRYKVDVDLIEYLARMRPEYRFVLIGSLGEGEGRWEAGGLAARPHVSLQGHRSYAELPRLIHEMDVCIIPSCFNDYTRAMFPMKFFEYLAAGKPVVAIDTGSLTEFGAWCSLCMTAEEFLAAVDAALTQDSDEWKIRRSELAKKYTYERRTAMMLEQIDRFEAGAGGNR